MNEREKWVRVSTELLAQLGEWSEPVRVKIISDTDNVLDMIFERVEPSEVRSA
jgi:hypothetical protein